MCGVGESASQALGWQRAWHVPEAIGGRGLAQRRAFPVVATNIPVLNACWGPEVKSLPGGVFRKPLPLVPGRKVKSESHFSGHRVSPCKAFRVFPGPSTRSGLACFLTPSTPELGALWGPGLVC